MVNRLPQLIFLGITPGSRGKLLRQEDVLKRILEEGSVVCGITPFREIIFGITVASHI